MILRILCAAGAIILLGTAPVAAQTADTLDVTALRRAASVSAAAGRHHEAIALLERARRLAPADRELMHDHARVLGWAGRYDAAATLYRELLDRNPADLEALAGLARVSSWRGDLRTGERLWRTVVSQAPRDVDALTGLGANLLWQGRDAEALAVLRGAHAIDPRHAELLVQLELAEAAVAPRAEAAFTHEEDADGNRIGTLAATSSLRIATDVGLRVDAYQRWLHGPGLAAESQDADAWGAAAGLSRTLRGGWVVNGALGASATSGADGALLTARAALATPRRHPLNATIAYHRAALDYTALLAVRRVRTELLALDAAARISPAVSVHGSVAATQFQGSERNRQLSATLGASYRLRAPFTLGVAARTFAYEKDRDALRDGYFNPDRYALLEVNGVLQQRIGRVHVTAELSPGVQRIGADGAGTASLRAAGRAAWVVGPGRELGVTARYAKSGLQQLSPGDAGEYHHRALGVFATWTFARRPRT